LGNASMAGTGINFDEACININNVCLDIIKES